MNKQTGGLRAVICCPAMFSEAWIKLNSIFLVLSKWRHQTYTLSSIMEILQDPPQPTHYLRLIQNGIVCWWAKRNSPLLLWMRRDQLVINPCCVLCMSCWEILLWSQQVRILSRACHRGVCSLPLSEHKSSVFDTGHEHLIGSQKNYYQTNRIALWNVLSHNLHPGFVFFFFLFSKSVVQIKIGYVS